MSYGLSKTSGLKVMYLEGKDPVMTSSTDIKFKYDRAQIPEGFGVTSTDDITFNIPQGASYILLANVYWIHTSRYGDMNFCFSFYNDDTSSFIGTAGGHSLYVNYDTDPFFPTTSSLVLLNADIPTGGINISTRFKSVLDPVDDNWLANTTRTDGTFEGQNIFSTRPITVKPTFTIIKTDN